MVVRIGHEDAYIDFVNSRQPLSEDNRSKTTMFL